MNYLLLHDANLIRSSHRHAVIGCILSHVNSWRSVRERRSLLASLSGIADTSHLRGILPLLSPLSNDKSEEAIWLFQQSDSDQVEYLDQLFDCLTPQSATLLSNEQDGPAWHMLLSWLNQENPSRKRHLTKLAM